MEILSWVGVIVLKRLTDAIADGDGVHARDPGHRLHE